MSIIKKEYYLKDGTKKIKFGFCIEEIDKNGKRKQKKICRWSTERKAMAAFKEFKPEDFEENTKYTFEELLTKYIQRCKDRNFAKATVVNYESLLKNHLGCFVDKKLSKIFPINVDDWLTAQLKANKSAYIINNCLKLCKAAFNYGVKYGFASKNPFGDVKRITEPPKIHNHLGTKEAFYVLEKCKVVYPDFYPMLALAMFSGMRQGEILGLKWADIDFQNNTIFVNRQYTRGELKKRTKTIKSTRTVDLPPFLSEILMDHKIGSKLLSEFVFTNQIGGMPSPTNITRRRFKPLLEACGYKRNYMRFHDLRGTYVDIMLSQGIQDNYVQKQVGHSKISTTKDVYSNIIPEVNRHAVDILEKVYRKNTKKIRDQNVTKKRP